MYFSHSTLSNLFLIDTISADYGSYEFPVPDSILTDSAIIVMKSMTTLVIRRQIQSSFFDL